ncbi:tRNA/rRNA methyltransferase [soil metagenome]
MTDRDPPSDSPYRGPPKQRMDKRARERAAAAQGRPATRPGTREDSPPPRHATRSESAPRHGTRSESAPRAEPAEQGPPEEQRYYGVNACLALFRHRPEALRKLWLLESRIPVLKQVLAWCAAQRLGYTIVESGDLERLSGSQHHEGVVFGAMPPEEQTLSDWLRALAPGPQLALWLDGVGNPHNLGAMLRSAAHFGSAGLLMPKFSTLTLSGAAARVAEGGAEAVPLVRLGRTDNALAQLQSAGFVLAATVVRGGEPLHGARLPSRLVLVMGAEQTGVDPALAQASRLRLSIPGTGAVDSLNVAAATAVLLSEWRRQH